MRQRYFLYFILLFAPFPALAQYPPIEFIRNDGQWKGPFQYKAATGKGDVYLAGDAFTYVIGHPANQDRMDAVKHGQVKHPATLEFHAYKMFFEGALKPEIRGSKEQSWYYNYFLGNDQSRWHSGIHPALALDYEGLYEGINMHIASEKGNLKYEFVIQPGAGPEKIRLRYEGADGLSVRDGNLHIKTSVGEVEELKPFAYQYVEGVRKQVSCRYRLSGTTVTYSLPDGYDATRALIIDPTIVFCTFTGSTADNWGFTATYDPQGNFYAGGLVNSTGFPVSTGAFQMTFAGGFTDFTFTNPDHGSDYASDIGIIKFNPTGTTKIYATYLGGSDNDQPHSLIVDANNNLIIAGRTYSSDFPVTAGAYDMTHNLKADIIVTKLNATGTALIGSTYIGGSGDDGVNYNALEDAAGNLKHNYGDDARSEVLVDRVGNIYVTASTKSTNFPLANATQSALSGTQDGVVFKLNGTLTNLLWSTYLGGTADDAGYVLALDTAQTHLYVGGGTMSNNFPSTTGTWHTTYQGGAADGYIAKFLNSSTYLLQKVCFIGTVNEDQVYGIQVDLENNVYAMGQSLGGAFPVTTGVYSNTNSSQFVIKLDSNLATDIFSTVYGSGDPTHTNISPVAFLVDTCQNVYISGWGGNLGITTLPTTVGTTAGMPTTAGAAQTTTDGYDFYFIVFSKNAQSLLYATFYGRSSTNPFHGEHVDGGTSRFDKSGIVYQAICGGCGGTTGTNAGPAFPTTPGSYSPINGNSSNCNEVALKIAFQLGAVDAGANANPNAKGCPPFTVQFQNSSTNATAYDWNFGDNTPVSTVQAPLHTFQSPGVYSVRLIAINPNACRTRDTTFLTIIVDTNHIQGAFTAKVIDSCGPYRASFVNTSVYGTTPGAQNFTLFTWFFGDGSSYTGANPPVHNYAAPGTFTVMLVMKDTTACNSPDTVRKIITINSLKVKADFHIPDSICVSSGLLFTSISTNATSTLWTFGDGQTSTAVSTTHTYLNPGTYTVTLIVSNPVACNKTDTLRKTITTRSLPTADFIYAPVIPVANQPIQFTNQSLNAVTYTWSFGDGAGSTDVNPGHLFRKTGHFHVCLVARNTQGCADTVCKDVEADVRTGIDLPNAFSPNGDGNGNDILYAKGGAIESMDLKIFNRWGLLVFESNDLAVGWDGTYKGKPQEMDAYGYVLSATFIDGTSVTKKGNITLLR